MAIVLIAEGAFGLEQIGPEEFRSQLLRELDAVHRLAYHLTLSADAADELCQDTYLRALKSYGTFRVTERGPRPWLFKILHNLYRTQLGRKGRQVYDSDSLDEAPAPPPTPLPDQLDWEQLDDRLKTALLELSPAHRTVMLLWAVEGLSYKQIAEVTETPIGTVMSRLFRARQTLADQVSDLASERRMAGEA